VADEGNEEDGEDGEAEQSGPVRGIFLLWHCPPSTYYITGDSERDYGTSEEAADKWHK
jgi:hypothetical protein